MNDLIERIEAASGPDRDLDEKIGMAVGLKNTIRVGHECLGTDRIVPVRCPYYTESIDAALTLVPEGAHCGMGYDRPCFGETVGRAWAWVRCRVNGVWEETPIDRQGHRPPTIALALCAAALKSRAYLKETNNAD